MEFLKKLGKYLLFALITIFLGLIGGFFALPFQGHLPEVSAVTNVPSASDVISVANTYIVFTTFIFAGLAVFFAILGVVFTQHFAASKEDHTKHLLEELSKRLEENKDDIAIKLLDNTFANKDAVKHLEEILSNKIQSIIVKQSPLSSKIAEE